MLGSMISKIRKEQQMTKVELSKRTGINIGHITHIEKGEINPSHKALKSITTALNVPYQIITHLYDKVVTEDDKRCEMIKTHSMRVGIEVGGTGWGQISFTENN